MTTYQVFKDGQKIKDNVSPNDLYKEIPAAARISGSDKHAKYKCRDGTEVEIIQNESK